MLIFMFFREKNDRNSKWCKRNIKQVKSMKKELDEMLHSPKLTENRMKWRMTINTQGLERDTTEYYFVLLG